MSDPEPARATSRLRVALFCLLPVIVLAAGTAVWSGRQWRQELVAEVQSLEQAGCSINTESLLPQLTPATEAAGAGLTAAGDDLDRLPYAVKRLSTGVENMAQALADPPGEKGFLVWEHDPKDPDCPPDLPSAAALYLARLAQHEPAIAAAIANRPCFRPDLTPTGKNPGHYLAVRNVTAGLTFRSSWRALHGDLDGAWGDVERILAALALLEDDPTLMAWLCWCSSVDLQVIMIEQLLSIGPPSPERRSRIDAALARCERPRLLLALRDHLREQLSWSDMSVDELIAKGGKWQGVRLRVEKAVFMERWRRDLALHLGAGIRALAAAQDPSVARQDAFTALDERAPTGSLLVREYHLELATLSRKEIELLTRLRLGRAGLALAALEQLPQELSLPVDPCDLAGSTLRWRRESVQRGLLWSVGRDQADDGGNDPDDQVDGAPGTDLVFRVALVGR